MYKLKLGVSLNYFVADPEQSCPIYEKFFDNLKIIEDLGFDTVDMSLSGAFRSETFVGFEEKVIRGVEAIKNSKLEFNGVHLPFGSMLSLSTLDEDYRQELVGKIKSLLNVIDKYSPKCYIMHSSSEPIADKEREAQKSQLAKSYLELKDSCNAYFCIENLPRTCLLNTGDEVLEMSNKVGGMNICLDVNHFLKEKTEDAILKIGSLIKTTHISDHDYVDERHNLPGKESIDFMKVIGAFEKIGYNGSFTYEVGIKKYGYTLKDIKDNYDMLFEKYNQSK